VTTAPTWSLSAAPIDGRQAYAELLNAGFSAADALTGTAIAMSESSLNATAISPPASDQSRGYGLWQIEYPTHASIFPGGTVTNPGWILPANNAAMAREVFSSQGWGGWSTYTSKVYLANMPAAALSQAAFNQQAANNKQSAQAFAATLSKADTVSFTPLLGTVDLGTDLGDAASTAAESAGEDAQSFGAIYQGFGSSLMRVFEIFLGGALLLIGLKQLTNPVTAPITSAVKKLPIPV